MAGSSGAAHDWVVIQAEGSGVTGTRPDGSPYEAKRLDSEALGGWRCLVRPPTQVDFQRTLEFARAQVGAHYGFFTIASIAVDVLTPNWFHVPFMRPGTWICSALGAESLRYGGWLQQWPDIYQCTPAEVMHALLGSGGREIDLSEAQPGDVGFGHSKGFVGAAIRWGERLNREADWEVNHVFLLDRYQPSATS